MRQGKSTKKGVVAAVCMSCGRELRISNQDDPVKAVKRKRWSNANLKAKPISALCQVCRKNGNHR